MLKTFISIAEILDFWRLCKNGEKMQILMSALILQTECFSLKMRLSSKLREVISWNIHRRQQKLSSKHAANFMLIHPSFDFSRFSKCGGKMQVEQTLLKFRLFQTKASVKLQFLLSTEHLSKKCWKFNLNPSKFWFLPAKPIWREKCKILAKLNVDKFYIVEVG